MALSHLQRYILTTCFAARSKRLSKDAILDYYVGRRNAPVERDRPGTVTKSIERLIERGLVTVRGTKTPRKLFITDVRLTAKGRLYARRLLGEQQVLPLRTRRSPPSVART